MKARDPLQLLALFALAFVVALFALKRPDPAASGEAKTPLATQLTRVAGVDPHPQPQPAGTPTSAARPAVSSDGPSPEPVVPPVAEDSEARPIQATPGSALVVREAIDALRHSTSTDERLGAIKALAASAREAHEVSRVREFLRMAAADENLDVAARAQEAFEQLTDREDP